MIDRVTDASLSHVPISHYGLTMSSFEVRGGEQLRAEEQLHLPRSNGTFAQSGQLKISIQADVGWFFPQRMDIISN